MSGSKGIIDLFRLALSIELSSVIIAKARPKRIGQMGEELGGMAIGI